MNNNLLAEMNDILAQQLSETEEEYIKRFKKEVNLHHISHCRKLSEAFISKFRHEICWTLCCEEQKLSEKLIRSCNLSWGHLVHWDLISKHQKLSEAFIREFKWEVDWVYLSQYQKLSENLIRDFRNDVDWREISRHQKLSEPFISEFKKYVDWYEISEYQELSESFIEKFKDKVNWYNIYCYQRLSESFMKKFPILVGGETQYRKHHQKVNKEEEIQAYAKKHNLVYENGILHAFRNHDQWGRGSFNKTIFYEEGQYYRDWHCDLDPRDEASFGLGIWPKGNTPIEIKVEDWGTTTKYDNNGKARVWGFTCGKRKG